MRLGIYRGIPSKRRPAFAPLHRDARINLEQPIQVDPPLPRLKCCSGQGKRRLRYGGERQRLTVEG
eukprot:919885-Lingulodinium_polyedra.AAC.1